MNSEPLLQCTNMVKMKFFSGKPVFLRFSTPFYEIQNQFMQLKQHFKTKREFEESIYDKL